MLIMGGDINTFHYFATAIEFATAAPALSPSPVDPFMRRRIDWASVSCLLFAFEMAGPAFRYGAKALAKIFGLLQSVLLGKFCLGR